MYNGGIGILSSYPKKTREQFEEKNKESYYALFDSLLSNLTKGYYKQYETILKEKNEFEYNPEDLEKYKKKSIEVYQIHGPVVGFSKKFISATLELMFAYHKEELIFDIIKECETKYPERIEEIKKLEVEFKRKIKIRDTKSNQEIRNNF